MRFLAAGDQGLIVECGEGISPAVNDQVHRLAGLLENEQIPGLLAVVPTYRSVGVAFDPSQVSAADLRARIEVFLTAQDSTAPLPSRLVELPTVYGGEYGPDLPFVAKHAGLTPDEAIRTHSGTDYRVYMIGFTAGFAYLGGLPEKIHTPRLPSPRIRTPKGSVGIGGSQTGAYPADTPGGWRLIGRTPVTQFDPLQDPPTPLLPGDRVRFVPVTEEEFRRLETEQVRAARREPRAANREGVERRAPNSAERRGIELLRGGLLTTVQDRGRIGTQKFGVPVSGAMDEVALRVGNALVGNWQGAAGLEITVAGPRLRFLADSVVALTGAELDADLDGVPIPWYESFRVRADQVLDLRNCLTGFRAYLTVAGGIDVPLVLGSRSASLVAGFGGGTGRALREGDRLPIGAAIGESAERIAPCRWRPSAQQPATVRVVLGPEDDAFNAEGIQTFLSGTYEVTAKVDRMGCRLDGPRIAHAGPADILSDWIPPGGIQVPGEGKPIILLADRQTTGGYTKIATVIGADLGRVAQQRPGALVCFRAVSAEDAEAVARQLESDLARLPDCLIDAGIWQVLADTGEIPDPAAAPSEAGHPTGDAP